jgi:hypothetical protein
MGIATLSTPVGTRAWSTTSSKEDAAVPAVTNALLPLIGGALVEMMQTANRKVDQDGETPVGAAGLIAGRPDADASRTAAP